MSEEINHRRRRFLEIAALTVAAAQFTPENPAAAQTAGQTTLDTLKTGANTSFASLKQIDAGLWVAGIRRAHRSN